MNRNYPSAPSFRLLAGPTDFYFLRHGESEGNRNDVIQGHLDHPLTPAGKEHARAAGAWFRDQRPELILTSPLKRSLQTARIVAEECGGPEPVVEPLLIELDTGVFTGKDLGTIADSDPGLWKRFRRRSWQAVPEAETTEAMYARARRYWQLLIDESSRRGIRRILTVTHGGMLQWLLRSSLGNREWMPIFTFSNCGISRLVAEPLPDEGTGFGDSFFAQWMLVNHIPY